MALAAVDRAHPDFAAERRLHHRDRHAAEKIGAVALIEGMRLRRDENVEIAGRPAAHARLAFAGEADARAVLDARRNVDREVALARHPAGARAGRAWIVDDFALAVAMRAGALDREEALLRPDAPIAAAGRAGARLGARLGARAGAGRAGDRRRQSQIGGLAGEGLLKRDFEIVAQIRAARGAVAAAAPRRPITSPKRSSKISAIEAPKPSPRSHWQTAALLEGGMAEAVIGGALLRIGEASDRPR